jgi:arylsulfatase A-like enzyme
MDQARFEGDAPRFATACDPERTLALGFEPGAKPVAWLGRRDGRNVNWESDPWKLATLTADGGVHGGALRIGPGLPEDSSYLSMLVPARPMCRYRLRGRVRLADHPAADEASAREVARLVELTGHLKEPTGLEWRSPAILRTHRIARTREASGFDRFEGEIELTSPETDTLEIRLLHRSGGSAAAATWFDDVELVETPVSQADVLKQIVDEARPNDRHAAETPWRLRVSLPADGNVKQETRDALLLPAPQSLVLPVELPPAATRPLLRFAYGLLPDAFAVAGDGARIAVSFAPEGGAGVELGRFDLDPAHDASQRAWLHARVDLAPAAGAAGRKGLLRFTASDRGAHVPLDAIVLATPRIEPAGPPAASSRAADAATGPMNVLLMASDTLRADHLNAFGYARPTAPNLKLLADRGVRFTRTRSQAPWTLPSFSSILTSLYPSEHGAGRGGHDEWTPLASRVTTLADTLAQAGYETVGITANHLIAPEYGLDQGFESYAIPGEEEWRRIGLESVSLDAPLVVKFLESHRATPFFLFWHMMDPHLPYTTPAEVRARFVDPNYHGRFEGPDPVVPFEVLDPRPGRRWFTQEGPPKPPPLSEADRKFVSDYYDAEIGEIDDAIGTVLATLEKTGLAQRTIVAMIADHGEGLGDHGHYHHGYTLFEDQVHIPFILSVPGGAKGVAIDAPTSSIDVAPTLLGALGLPIPASFRGRDLHEAAPPKPVGAEVESPDQEALAAEPVYCEYPSYDSSAQKACVLGDFKYLHDPWFHTEALYDTRRDPAETKDVRAGHPAVVARARELLDAFRWERMQSGRFHLLLHGHAGARLRLTMATDDLFDANFACRPLQDEHRFTLDLERQHLVLETELEGERLELVCWCRGDHLTVEATLDGKPVAAGVRLGADEEGRPSPLKITRGDVPSIAGETLKPPKPDQLLFWLEPGVGAAAPVVPSPESADMLRRLGYAH